MIYAPQRSWHGDCMYWDTRQWCRELEAQMEWHLLANDHEWRIWHHGDYNYSVERKSDGASLLKTLDTDRADAVGVALFEGRIDDAAALITFAPK